MSIIIRRPETGIVLFCKGADNISFERLASGHRTLTVAYRVLDKSFYESWAKKYQEASTAINERSSKIDACADEIEKDPILLGATVIENKLKESVPECIEQLRGDKLETAINIGFVTQLLTKDMRFWIVKGSKKETVEKQLDNIYASLITVDSSALAYLLDDEKARLKILELSDHFYSVICCCVSPLQKALVVDLVRRGKDLQHQPWAANVVVGISRQEGVQAAMASDYNIAQFRYLKKLLLVHGHWDYMRTTDQSVCDSYCLKYPSIYSLGIKRMRYSKKLFTIYFLDGIWQSLIVYFTFYFIYSMSTNVTASQGLDAGSIEFSTSVALTVIITANLFVCFNTYYWNWIVWAILISEIVIIFSYVLKSPIYGIGQQLIGEGTFWFGMALAILLAFLPRYVITFVKQWWYPDDLDIFRQIRKSDKIARKEKLKKSKNNITDRS
ncbi:36381_t:CDS:2 [Gigaspora margarita]|uniref:36381_t:CDS:1 n=1 Tax=Gigaspora margarita TaxID=4874 RepID=A0ABN7VFB1_GIGMA|nr:36381_t:CDS:2 [Gigaspora margarita]